MNQSKCKKQKYKKLLTFNELIKKLNPQNLDNNKFVLKELIKHYSKKIKDDDDIFFEKNSYIDFSYKNFLKDYKKVIFKNFPVNYITKKCYFYKYQYYIKKPVLVPRSDTEILVDFLLNLKQTKKCKKILDLCSGSGIIANTLFLELENKDIKIVGIEKYLKPYLVSLKNKKKFNTDVLFLKKDFFKLKIDFIKDFDLIICNPPYISKDDKDVDISTKFESKKALYAKENGLRFYKYFLKNYFPYLKKETKVIFEIGFNSNLKLQNFLEEINIKNYSFIKDWSKNYRILYIEK